MLQAREMATHHPALVLPHVPALLGCLQQELQAVSNAAPDLRSTTLRTLSRALGLLEALRPELQRRCNWQEADCGEMAPVDVRMASAVAALFTAIQSQAGLIVMGLFLIMLFPNERP